MHALRSHKTASGGEGECVNAMITSGKALEYP